MKKITKKQYRLDKHAADMLENFFRIKAPKNWIITDEIIAELKEKCGFRTTKETLNNDFERYHHEIVGI